MKQFFIGIMAMLMCMACEKPLMTGNQEEEETEGNLKIKVFEIEKTPFGSLTRATEEASAVCKHLNYAVYSTSGERLKQVNQTTGTSEFGTASFQLDEGKYRVVVVGHSSNGNPTMTDPTCIKFTNAQGFTDTFVYCDEVTVGEDQVELKVSLNRIVSMCRFVLTDDIPKEIKKMRFYYTGGSGAFDATTSLGCVNSKQDVKIDITNGDQKQFDLYTFLHDEEGVIHLAVSALDASGNELYAREFDVPMEQNHITWLSGAFFSGVSTTTVTGVTVNTTWEGEQHLTF